MGIQLMSGTLNYSYQNVAGDNVKIIIKYAVYMIFEPKLILTLDHEVAQLELIAK